MLKSSPARDNGLRRSLDLPSSVAGEGNFCSLGATKALMSPTQSLKGVLDLGDVLGSENIEVEVNVLEHLTSPEDGGALVQDMVLSSCLQEEEKHRELGKVQMSEDMQMVLRNGECTKSWGHQGREVSDPVPLCSLPPHVDMVGSPLKNNFGLWS